MKLEQYFGDDYHYIWSDNWCLDGDKAFFMAGAMNMLFSLNRETRETDLVSVIPTDSICAFRKYPRCVKNGNMLVCLPDMGNEIWIYDLSSANSWVNIPVKNPKGIRLLCNNAWFVEEQLHIVSRGLKKIIIIDIKTKTVISYYDLLVPNGVNLSESILVNECIYIVGNCSNCICKFNCNNKSIEIFDLTEIDDELQTICFDGKKFWLSGKCRKIYIWEEENRESKSVVGLPDDFGIWNFTGNYKLLLNCGINSIDMPLFMTSVCIDKHIWFIPFQTNHIIFIDKETYEIDMLAMIEEDQTEDDVRTQLLSHKYLLEYIRDDRYIGIFSLKNKWIVEIDAKKFNYIILDYQINEKCKYKISKNIFVDYFKNGKSFMESSNFMLKDLIDHLLLYREENKDHKKGHVLYGENLYLELCKNNNLKNFN